MISDDPTENQYTIDEMLDQHCKGYNFSKVQELSNQGANANLKNRFDGVA